MFQRIMAAVFLGLMIGSQLSAADPELLRIGIMESLTADTSPRVREAFAPEFSKLVKDYTGLKSVTLHGLDPFTAARQVENGKWHLGVFHGVEFAWVQAKYPKLKPLMAVHFKRADNLRALVLVKKASDLNRFEDLKGKKACILTTKLSCKLFVDRLTEGKAQKFFGELKHMRKVREAFDDVLLGKVNAIIADSANLDFYKDIYPGRFNHLKIVARSEPFPTAVIAYRQGNLEEGTLKKLTAGLEKAGKTEEGRDAMDTFSISGFGPVPADYPEALAKIRKDYPGPR